ncbi:hypothetical protein HYH03_002864 [Edaphochlamys debaryana]|uniref:Pyrroline-5-carboxylate reductase catalytic N-terminal domain-containing protein n=1 Tax=Edaphochlamys debaryana TaxID=47281 RepID=A0A836C3N3_9CHLO|nr:hypothetical protein HYH03_002864 [Edaphochlamys debaryana]|eukprot:KAG2499286.1 hypothetical protein HYH03_002864 [Edaphochlamys debaryana]
MSVADAIKNTDVIIVAVPSVHDDAGIKTVADSLLGPNAAGKVIIDTTNPLNSYPNLEVRWREGTSAGEVLAAALPNSVVYKAFNTVGVEHMSHPDGSLITGQQLSMLFCGGPERLEEVEEVISAVGFDPAYVGPIRYARNLEAMAELWLHLGVPGAGTAHKWGRNFHFQALRKPPQ